jgi:phosphoserine aminotransferase
MRNLFFTPGPTALYFTAEEHMKNAIREGVVSTSHRGQEFKSIYKECIDNLRDLMGIPSNFHILLTSSANEAWERLIQNCVDRTSFHLCNGPFATRFATISEQLGKKVHKLEIEEGKAPEVSDFKIDDDVELIGLCYNESGTGVALNNEIIESIRKENPDKLIAIDAVSAVPVYPVDFTQIDSLYFSVQKAFGLPAGLGVWIVNDKCVQKAINLKSEGKIIGSYHQLPEMVDRARDYQTHETPNILGVYTLAKVAADMLEKGILAIRREIDYKHAILNMAVEEHPDLSHFVQDSKARSKTVHVINTPFDNQKLIDFFKAKQMVIGTGYGKRKLEQVRIANFPTHSKEQMEMLVDLLVTFKS